MYNVVPISDIVSEYRKNIEPLLLLEKQVQYNKSLLRVMPNYTVDLIHELYSLYDFRPQKIDLLNHYCPNGDLHKITKYVYKNNKVNTEYTSDDIIKFYKTDDINMINKFMNMTLIDERCGKCNTLIRSANSGHASDATLNTLFKKIDDLLAFYEYYDVRCPKGDLHEYNKDNCKKCGFNTDFRNKKDKAYYDKYINEFKKIEKEKISILNNDLEINKQNIKNADHEHKQFIGSNKAKQSTTNKYEDMPYINSHKNTADWGQRLNIKYNLLVNLGLSEGNKYIDLELANINPSKNNPNYNMQALKIRGYILHVLREYNMFVLDELHGLPALKEIKGAQNIQTTKYTLPSFNFLELENNYKYLPKDKYINFLLEYLAKIIIDINKCNAKIIAEKLPDYFTKYILNTEKTMSKAQDVFYKVDESIDKLENLSDENSDLTGENLTENESIVEVHSDNPNANEKYSNEINYEGFDVENANDIWDME